MDIPIEQQRLTDWILEQIHSRGWNLSDYASKGNLESSLVSRTLRGQRPVSLKFIVGTARSFDSSPVDVCRVYFGDDPLNMATFRILGAIFRRLDPEAQADLISFAMWLDRTHSKIHPR